MGMSITRRIAALLGGASAIGFCAGASAQGLDLRDRIVLIEISVVRESTLASPRDRKESSTSTAVWKQRFDLVAGKVVTDFGLQVAAPCHLGLVYAPGPTKTGKIDCKPERRGTASDWTERGITATYRTQSAVAGNVLTLKGEVKGTSTYHRHCFGKDDSARESFTITQSLKVRIIGETCEVLEFSEVKQEDIFGGDGDNDRVRETSTLAPSRSCTLKIRSEEPPPKPFEGIDLRC